MMKYLGYPLIELGKALIKLGAWCLGGTANVTEDVTYDYDK